MKKITREQAASAGQKTFYTGKPCRTGHIAERWVVSGTCVECGRAHSRTSAAKARKKWKRQVTRAAGIAMVEKWVRPGKQGKLL